MYKICLDFKTVTSIQRNELVRNLILVDGEEDESVGIEGLDLHGDGQVTGVVVPDVPLHRVPGPVERVAGMLDNLIKTKFS